MPDALYRIVQGLAKLDGRALGIGAEGLGHVQHGLGRLIENVVALAGLVPNIREREQERLARFDRLVIELGALLHGACERIYVLGAYLGGAARGFQDGRHLGVHLLGLHGRVNGALQSNGRYPEAGSDGEPGALGDTAHALARLGEIGLGAL